MITIINPNYKAEILVNNGWNLNHSTTYPGQYYWYKWSIDRSIWDYTSYIYIDEYGEMKVTDDRMTYFVSVD